MRVLSLLLLLVAAEMASGQTMSTFREGADDLFRLGVELRHDSSRAVPTFRTAAMMYDACFDGWEPKYRSSSVALMRGRAHYLAGDLPKAIRALHDGLEIAPWDAELQRALALCRARVAYPTEATPTERVRPDPTRSLRNRLSQADLLALSALASLALTIGLARRFTNADGWATPLAVIAAIGLLLIVGLGIAIDRQNRHEREYPILVLSTDTELRTGNASSFMPRIEARIPRGAEVRELGRRGGWVQVEVPGGAVGWLPQAAVLGGKVDKPAEPGGPAPSGIQDLLD